MQTYFFVFLSPTAPTAPVKEALLSDEGGRSYLICTKVEDSFAGFVACRIHAREGVPDDVFHVNPSHIQCVVEMPKGQVPVGFRKLEPGTA